MQRKLDVSLWDLLEAGKEIPDYTAGKTLADYLGDRQHRRSVERCYTILGEAMVRITDGFPTDHARMVAATKLIGLRNHLVHRYDVVDDEEMWKITESSLPLLLREATLMLEETKA